MLTDGNGVSEQDVTYYPYGDTRSNTGTADVPYKYTGKEQDNSTGLYFYEARYYDPVLGRFISADTIVPSLTNPQALNRYAYANNNPILYNDPSGHFGFKSIKKGFKKAYKGFKKLDRAAWKYRHYWSPGTIAIDFAFTNSTIGPYARGIAFAAASYFGGPLGAAGVSAYTTRLDGGSLGDAIKSGAIAGVSSYVGGEVGGFVGGAATELGTHAAVAQVVGAAASGAVSATISGSDPGMGALYAAGIAGASYGGQAAYQYYTSKDVVGTQQLAVDEGGQQITRNVRPRPGSRNALGEALGGVPDQFVKAFGRAAAFQKFAEVNAKFYELEGLVPYGDSGKANVWVNINKSSSGFGEVGGALGSDNLFDPVNYWHEGRFIPQGFLRVY